MSDVELFSQGAAAAPSDARQSARINVSWRARVLVTATQFIEGRAINVSETGVGLLLPQAMPVGARLTAAMAVPDSADRSHIIPVTLQIKVVFNVASGDQFKVGCQIAQLDDAGRKLIRHWINKS
ncbi:MAG: PilZ domain-containing protein [Aquabacterium sp.]